MKSKIIISFIIFSSVLFSQPMRNNSSVSLFSDYKAMNVGDAITIVVMESSEASNNAQTSTGRNSALGVDFSGGVGDTKLPNVNTSIGSKNKFDGSGSTKTTGLIKTRISATIDSVLPNGNLLIRGSRKLVINGEEQLITIKGIVRSSDILADNSVLSYNVSEAEIIFEGSGTIKDSQKPGWLTRLFHWLF